jgi:nucleotide-binding universal stress UspA family protein
LTVPGGYGQLLEHIQVHRYFMGLEQKREISIEQAAGHWYEHVYLPVVEIIRGRGVLRDFSDRTETDLYLWISEHRESLKDELQMDVRTDEAAADLAERFGSRLQRVVDRFRRRILEALTPDELEAGPSPGYWRRDRLKSHGAIPLFTEILVPLSGEPDGWRALDQAQVVAQREGATIYGLRVTTSNADVGDEDIDAIRSDFQNKCAQAGVEGTFLVDEGEVAKRVCERSRWTDLVIVSLAHPPGETPLGRLGSGFRLILRRCPRPVLAVPGPATDMQSCLLAYDGSPKAEEALYLAAYISNRWSCPLTVVTVEQFELDARAVQSRGRGYLERHNAAAEYLIAEGDPAETLLQICAERGAEVMLMGGYGAAPMVEVVLGSTVDRILRAAQVPLLICR